MPGVTWKVSRRSHRSSTLPGFWISNASLSVPEVATLKCLLCAHSGGRLAMLDLDTIKLQRFDWAHQLDKAGVGAF